MKEFHQEIDTGDCAQDIARRISRENGNPADREGAGLSRKAKSSRRNVLEFRWNIPYKVLHASSSDKKGVDTNAEKIQETAGGIMPCDSVCLWCFRHGGDGSVNHTGAA
jgi:hypothetical protein